MKLIKFKKLSEKLGGRSRGSVDRDMKKRGFPTPITVGRSVAWDEEAVDRWLQEQAAKPYQPEPVAVPAPGKRRGRPSKAEKSAKSIDLVPKEEVQNMTPEVDRIKKRFQSAMFKAGILPPNEIIADGNLHFINDRYESGYYVLNLEKFPVGTYGCTNMRINKKWVGKHFDNMDFKEQHYYQKETTRMKKLRIEADEEWLGLIQ